MSDGHWVLFEFDPGIKPFVYAGDEEDDPTTALIQGSLKAYAARGRSPRSAEITPQSFAAVVKEIATRALIRYPAEGVQEIRINTVVGSIVVRCCA